MHLPLIKLIVESMGLLAVHSLERSAVAPREGICHAVHVHSPGELLIGCRPFPEFSSKLIVLQILLWLAIK